MRYSIQNRLRERRSQRTISDWIREWKDKIEIWRELPENQRNLIATCAMNELLDIIEIGTQKAKFQVENR